MVSKFKKHSLCIIIPMYNEELGAEKCIKAVILEVKKLKVKSILAVVDDGSNDKTPEILKNLSHKYGKKLKVIHHKKNMGYGAGLQSGIAYAAKNGFEFTLFMDSDLTDNPIYIKIFASMLGDNVDCVKASRLLKESRHDIPLKRKIYTLTANAIASRLFNIGLKDCTYGYRMTRLSLIKDINFKQNDFSIILEELYHLKRKKAKFKDFPVKQISRTNTDTSFSYTPTQLWDYLKYALKAALI